MPIALIGLFSVIAAGLAVVLIPGVEQRLTKSIEDINGSMVKGVTGPIVGAWVWVAVIGAGLGLGIWALERKIGESTGEFVPLPSAPSLALPPAPTFGAASGLTAGPFRTSTNVGSGQSAPALPSAPTYRMPAAPIEEYGPLPPPPPRSAPMPRARAVGGFNRSGGARAGRVRP